MRRANRQAYCLVTAIQFQAALQYSVDELVQRDTTCQRKSMRSMQHLQRQQQLARARISVVLRGRPALATPHQTSDERNVDSL